MGGSKPSQMDTGNPDWLDQLQKRTASCHQPCFVGTLDGKVLACNDNFASLLGYSKDEIKEMSWQINLTHPQGLGQEMENLNSIKDDYLPSFYEKQFIHRLGFLISASITALRLDHAHSPIIFLISLTHQISTLNQTLLDLNRAQAQSARYKELMDSISELFFIYDLNGRITYINRKCSDMTGYQPDELVGRYVWEFVVTRHRSRFIEEMQLRLIQGETSSYLIKIEHRDGSERIFQVKASPIYRKGKLQGEMVLAEDVTESRDMEKALRRSNENLLRIHEELEASNQQLLATEDELRKQLDEAVINRDALADAHQRLETILNFLPEPTYVVDSQGRVQIWNHAMEELTGIKVRDIMGRGNFEYAIPFFGRRLPMLIDMSLDPAYCDTTSIPIRKQENDTLFAEYFCPQLGVNGAYLSCKSSPLRDRSGNVVGAIETIRDVTEHRLTLKALFESESKYRNMIERIEDGYFEVDLQGTFQFCNRFMHEIVGYRYDEFLGTTYKDWMDENNAIKVKTVFNRVYQTGKPVREFEWYVRRRDGSQMVVESTVLPIMEDNKVVGFRGLIRDVSDSWKAKQALQASEANLRKQVEYLNTLMDNLHEMFFTYDRQGRMLFVNKQAYQVVGYTPEEMIGLHVADFVMPQNRDDVYEGIRARVEEGQRGSYELPLIHKNGSIRIIKLNSSPLYGDNNTIIGGMVLAEDITERKRAQKSLEISEAQYRAIVEDQTELICRWLPGNKMAFVNEAYSRYYNQTRNELLQTSFNQYIHPDEHLRVEQMINSLSPANPSCTMEYRVILPDGSIRWQQWTHRAIFDPEGELRHYQSVGRDITEQKRAEEQLTYMSQHDSLTGLYNRLYFEQILKCQEDSHDPVGLIIFDMDGLKLVNDTMGHEQGDRLLRVFCDIVKPCFSSEDVLARVGGDEFAAVIPCEDRRLLEVRIQSIRDAVMSYNNLNQDLPISVSIGFAFREDSSVPMSELFKNADDNMYREKLLSSRSARSAIVQTLMKDLEDKDFINEGHAERLQVLVEGLARAIDLPERSINELRLLAQFHDIGKVGIPDNILFKSEPLTDEEYKIMQRHCEIGHRIALSAPELMLISDWILKHHEWWNGQGYPLGIEGEEIPVECRILSIADAFDAMTHDRPYRKALSPEDALNELYRYAGTQFDPCLVEIFPQVLFSQGLGSENDQ